MAYCLITDGDNFTFYLYLYVTAMMVFQAGLTFMSLRDLAARLTAGQLTD
jgi:hypothetical protein